MQATHPAYKLRKYTFVFVVQQGNEMIDRAGTDTPSNQLHDGSVDKVTVAHSQALYQPKTPLGQRLWEICSRIVASSQPLLGWEDIERQVIERRGEVE